MRVAAALSATLESPTAPVGADPSTGIHGVAIAPGGTVAPGGKPGIDPTVGGADLAVSGAVVIAVGALRHGLIVRFALENSSWGYCRIQG